MFPRWEMCTILTLILTKGCLIHISKLAEADGARLIGNELANLRHICCT